MALQPTNKLLGDGGVGLNDQAGKAIRELQGMRVAIVAGASANAQINIAAIRTEDTVLSVIESAAGVLTDRTSTTSIVDLRATGTITVGAVVADNTVTVRGVVYTYKAAPASLQQVKLTLGDANANAAALAAAVNAYERRYGGSGWTVPLVLATVATNVVTITAVVEGTTANAYTIASNSANAVASAATLAGGSATGGIKNSVDTTGDSLIVIWFNKNA